MPKKKFVPDNHVAYDKTPVQLKVMPGVRKQLMTISDWQNKVRRFIDELLAEHGDWSPASRFPRKGINATLRSEFPTHRDYFYG